MLYAEVYFIVVLSFLITAEMEHIFITLLIIQVTSSIHFPHVFYQSSYVLPFPRDLWAILI